MRPPWSLRGYGPAVALAAAIVLMVVLVPSKSSTSGSGASQVLPLPPARATAGAGMPVTGDVAQCARRTLQVPADAYSPPCVSFTGDNGGATAPGVTAKTIVVSYRQTADGNYVSLIEKLLAGGDKAFKADTNADLQRTVEGLVDYFNRTFQLYGRTIKVVPYPATGSAATELFGGGQAGATADAVSVATSIHAFADVTAGTAPYADELTRRHVVALGVPYVSDQWFQARRPYAWSMTPSCTFVSEAAEEFEKAELLNRPAAYAGGVLKNKPRKLAIIAPDNPEYQRCAREGIKGLGVDGRNVLSLSYPLNLGAARATAGALITRLKADGITTVECACDTTMPIYLTTLATQQDYHPEWGVHGTALIDTDPAGQLYDQAQWAHAFGTSTVGNQPAFDRDPGVVAYRSVRSDRPANITESLYDQIYQLFLGVQMAGPDLTPTTFERGLFAYPRHVGVDGAWQFGPGKYTPQVDAQVVWWNPQRRSAFNGRLGGYVAAGPRYLVGTLARHPRLNLFTP